MALRKNEKADLRRRYPMYVEIGLAVALGLLIVAFRADISPESEFNATVTEQETVQMEEIQQTEQIERPPPPPRPPVPVEVPNEEILENEGLDLDASLDIDQQVDLPPPPPPKEEEKEPEPEIFIIVEEQPEPIGGLAALQARVKYPEMAKRANVEGRVFVEFIVDEQGNVTNPVVTRGIGAGCDEAAVEAILATKFTPGKQRNKAVKVKMSLPVNFKLR